MPLVLIFIVEAIPELFSAPRILIHVACLRPLRACKLGGLCGPLAIPEQCPSGKSRRRPDRPGMEDENSGGSPDPGGKLPAPDGRRWAGNRSTSHNRSFR